ncbi:isoprenylcysteine carboxylmethyltransferase family protein [Sporomusa acidovorans]|nr:isoprenylcysteine carboxylmethyltransferase family protein [Sporomusa acidovorans]
MIVLQFTVPIYYIVRFPFNFSGIVFIVIGLGISIIGSNLFQKLKISVMTFDEPSVLVTNGLYQYSRNPMYLGFVLFILGSWLFMGSLSALLIALLFIVAMDLGYIRWEEKMLDRKFGKAYLDYKRKVRRWI